LATRGGESVGGGIGEALCWIIWILGKPSKL
jgi:hypothetical protein